MQGAVWFGSKPRCETEDGAAKRPEKTSRVCGADEKRRPQERAPSLEVTLFNGFVARALAVEKAIRASSMRWQRTNSSKRAAWTR